MKGFWTAITMLALAFITRWPFEIIGVVLALGVLAGWLVA